MEPKTTVHAEEGRQDLLITRQFDLPVEQLYEAHTDPEIIAAWMATRVVKFEVHRHGGWEFETPDASGAVVFRAHGVFHELIPGERIVRTFEMINASFGVQLEILSFEALSPDTSRLTIQSIYRSAALRDAMLKLPFAFGINMAHNRLQDAMNKRK